MSFDGFFLHHMVKELKSELLGGRIQKINQISSNELVLKIRSDRKNQKFLISIHPITGRIQLTQENFTNPPVPSTFTMIARKYLQGAIITKIEQDGNDRILAIQASRKNEIDNPIATRLMVEIMGKHSNIILLNQSNNKIIDSIKHVNSSHNRYRTILPGSNYITPPKAKGQNPFFISTEKLYKLFHNQEISPTNFQKLFQGLGKDTATELVRCLGNNKIKNFQRFFTAKTQAQLNERHFSPISFSSSKKKFETLSSLLDFYYKYRKEKDWVSQQTAELTRQVSRTLTKNRHKLKRQKSELLATKKAEDFRQKGELLTAYHHKIPRNQENIRLNNYYTGQLLDIKLNPRITPNQNAQQYFQHYHKLKKASQHLKILIQKTKSTISYLENIETLINRAKHYSEISQIRSELIEGGFLKTTNHSSNIQQQNGTKPEKYLATDGKTVILVGHNNLQNEALTFKIAKKNELWCHAKGVPGSHVVITKNQRPTDEVKTDAAELAAYFSKARFSNLVQVDMIEVKRLNRPTGKKSGFVTYKGQKTLRVTPNEKKIKSMKM